MSVKFKDNYMKRQGYKWYVYIGNFQIEVFKEYNDALEFAKKHGAEAKPL